MYPIVMTNYIEAQFVLILMLDNVIEYVYNDLGSYL